MSVDTAQPIRRWRSALGGAIFTVFRVVWIALFGAGMITLGYIAPRDEVAFQSAFVAGSALGFWAFDSISKEGQVGAPLGDEGRRIGFKSADLLMTVDGRALPVGRAAEARLLDGPTGSIAVLGLRHKDGARYTVRVARDPLRLTRALAGSGINYAIKRWTQFGFNTTANVALLAAAALLLIRRPRDTVAQLLSFSIVLGSPSFDELLQIAPIGAALIGQCAWLLLMTALLLFPDGRLATRWHRVTIALFLANAIYQLMIFWFSWFDYASYALSGVLPLATMIIAVVVQYRRTPEGIFRQQSKFVLFGIVTYCVAHSIVILARVTTDFGSGNVGVTNWIILITNILDALALAALPAGLFVSLFRFRLYDAESTISRSVVYGTLALVLLGIFAGAEKMIEILGEHYFGEQLGALASGLGAGFAALMMVPLHHRVTHWAEQRFQGNLVHLRTALPVLANDMAATATPARLADAVLARVEAGVRAVHGAVVIGSEVLDARDVDGAAVTAWLAAWREPDSDHCHLHIDRADALFPMRVPLFSDSAGLAGWLLLGPRPDGSFYGKDERDVLLAVAEPVARAIAVARHREVDGVERKREIGGLATRLTALETRLAGYAPFAA